MNLLERGDSIIRRANWDSLKAPSFFTTVNNNAIFFFGTANNKNNGKSSCSVVQKKIHERLSVFREFSLCQALDGHKRTHVSDQQQ
jgi:hypothetical protein